MACGFLDKDGTLIPDIPYNIYPDKITLSEHAAEALKLLASQGFQFIVVTNQSGVARGYFKEEDLTRVKDKITRLLQEHSITLSGFYYCPHHYDEVTGELTCVCRKPLPGLLLKAAEEKNISLKDSWMIGDILNDVEAGARAGCRTILIDNGNETEWKRGPFRTPSFVAANLKEAASCILSINHQE
jgi:D-glycero-D-manno-heptose 1,7-bisphosphate phosphatase